MNLLALLLLVLYRTNISLKFGKTFSKWPLIAKTENIIGKPRNFYLYILKQLISPLDTGPQDVWAECGINHEVNMSIRIRC